MLKFKALTLEDKIIFDKYLKPYKFLTCEYSFTNLFIWRKGCDIQYALYEDLLIIKKIDFKGKSHLMEPLGYKKENLKNLIDFLLIVKEEEKLDFLFKDLEKPFIDDFLEVFPTGFTVEEDRDNFDYIYESSKLIELSGKKLHGKKNHYNNFVKNNEFTFSSLSPTVIDECIETAREWCTKNGGKGHLLYELKGIEELLNNVGKLDFIGLAVYIDGALSAFTIGERVNENMAIIHIEKADGEINGLYTYINKTFIENNFSDVPFINREQDLGKEGLRTAKLSYHPFKLEEKYIIL
ncbi:MAG TPA: phosphatidylglycerol lysyltransferase domain-containing protein [Clostridiaceae bacterium]